LKDVPTGTMKRNERMAYEVLARKWRPQQFDDVVGQEHVTRTLKNAIESERVAHAYLFVGPRGIGKTTTARILAKALNCAEGPTTTPCDNCDSCHEIMQGRSLDVIEVDGASNRGIDHIRELRDNVRYAPARGPFKIYIIDEVHMLTQESFNALLKTLEEPPPHVKFIFATTEPQKVLATILSRCQRFDLRPISTKQIIERLSEIAEAEGIDIDADALLAIARAAEGGLRDAESALDQLIAFQGKKIREDDVMMVFGLMARKTLEDLVRSILAGDMPAALKLVSELDEAGKDMQRVVVELLEYFRNVLIATCSEEAVAALDLAENQVAALKEQAGATDTGRVLRIINILTQADQRLRYALSKRTLVEVAVVRAARAASVATVEELLEELGRLRAELGGAPGVGGAQKKTADAVTLKPSVPSGAAVREEKPSVAPREPKREAAPSPKAVKREPAPSPKAVKREKARRKTDEVSMLEERWREIVKRVGQTAQLARGYLMDAKPVEVRNDSVVIGLDPEFGDKKEMLDAGRNRGVLQNVLKEVLGRPVRVEVIVMQAKDTLPGDIKVEKEDSGATKSGSRPLTGKRKMSAKARREWTKNEKVRMVLEKFGGDIIDIRE
jgi:DNA polymerase-3 subunit gamma/tau